jgi:sugar porter (SP) family MFS transporter
VNKKFLSDIWFWASIAALSGFLFGFDTAVISGAEQAVQLAWNTSNFLHGLAISAALWGTVIGALFGAIPSERLGRKKTLIWIGLLYTVSAIGSAISWSPESFIVFRLIGGLGVGASSIAAPAYISEIAPREKRGQLVALYQFMLVIGILAAYASNYLLDSTSENDWRWMVGVEAVPAMIYMFAVFFIPESPRWLVLNRGEREQALRILQRINPTGFEEDMELIVADDRTVSWREFLRSKYLKPIALAVFIAFFNQVSGINAIIYYAPRIFGLTGAADSMALLATVGIGVVNVVFTAIGMILIDRLGRKTLLIIGSVGYILSLGMVAYGFFADVHTLTAFFIFAFIASHAVGQGAVIWVYIAEIFPNAARTKGQAVGCGTHWVMAAALTLLMPPLLGSIDAWLIFAFFAIMMIVQLGFVLTFVVETKSRSLESLSAELLRS